MLFFVFALLIATVAPESASALPRYSAIYDQDCGLCHQDPTGGGLRSLYASQYLVPSELAARATDSGSIDPLLDEKVILGADLRTLFRSAEDESSRQFQMQTDLGLALLVDERTTIRVDIGREGIGQAFGLAYLLPAQGWVRAGRFEPNYGWKFADHQLFARRFVLRREGVRDPRSWESAGLEVGLSPGNSQWTVSLDDGGGPGDGWTASGLWRAQRAGLSFALGVSALQRDREEGVRRSLGVHGLVRLGRLVWLGQWDRPREAGRDELVVTQELSSMLARGWTLRVVHGFHDPDRDRRSGARQSLGFGVDVLATPFFGVLAMATYQDVEDGPAAAGEDGWSADVVLHFLY